MPSRSPILSAAIVAPLLAVVLCVGSPALAGPRDAKLKYQQGHELFAQKKYPEAVPLQLPRIDLRKPIEYGRL